MSAPVWPAKFLEVIRERDQARGIAVQLEQELHRARRTTIEEILEAVDKGGRAHKQITALLEAGE